MANQKQQYRWYDVRSGDIISFKYKSPKTKKDRVQSILVLNPKLKVTLKNGKQTRHLVGIKIEESNRMKLMMSNRVITNIQRIGDFKTLDEENNIYRLEIFPRFIANRFSGVKQEVFNMLKGVLQDYYRTYDYEIARKSSVFLEPLRVYQKFPLVEDESKTTLPQQPEPPSPGPPPPDQPEKPKGGR